MAIELITKVAPYVDEIFKRESRKGLLTNQDFSWTGAHTVKVYKVSTVDLGNYARTGSVPEGQWSRFGAVQTLDATTESMTLANDKSFTFEIDKLDVDETGSALEAASALAREVREVVIPTVDSAVYAKMVSGAGKKVTDVTLTYQNIYGEILKASTWLDDHEIPETERSLLVIPAVYEMMKKSSDIILDTAIGAEMRLRGVISNLDGVNVIKVPAARLPQGFGFMMAHKSATVAPTKLTDYRIHKDPPGISGSLVEGRIVYDAFVLDNKANGIYVCSESPSGASGASGESGASGASGATGE